MEGGVLYVVATPIGNLEDITYRAVRILSEADYILCEDTRVTGVLLKHHQIKTRLQRYDAHATETTHQRVIKDLQAGKRIALVSDAGTPSISDPGVILVAGARKAGARLEAIPGPSALTAAFSIAGLPGNQFTFLGYVPHKKGRETFLKTAVSLDHPAIFFESTHRILKTLDTLATMSPETTLYLGRELTKLHEEMLVGTAGELVTLLTDNPVKQKGEFVVIVD